MSGEDQKIHIRKATIEEAETLSDLAFRSKSIWPYDPEYLEKCRPVIGVDAEYISTWPVLVAEKDKQILGWGSIAEVKNDRWLDNLWIEPSIIKIKGLGRSLFRHLVKEAQNLHWTSFRIAADPYAEGFYLKMGAKNIGSVESLVKPGFFLPRLEYKIQTQVNLRSLAYKTDLSILAFEGRVEDKGNYYVAESPGNPGYFWGNLLVMKNPPQEGDFDRWTTLFRKEFGHEPSVKHITLGWDSPEATEGSTQFFVEQGFDVERSVVLTIQEKDLISSKKALPNLEIKSIQSDAEWDAVIENQILCRKDVFKLEKYIPFKRTQFKKYRSMANSGLGKWFGAFLGGQLVGDCGVYIFDGIGRFQSVETHPDFRGRGVCGNLVISTSRWAFSEGAHTLVMAADPEYHAAHVYESVGFRPTEKQIGMYRWPKEEWASDSRNPTI